LTRFLPIFVMLAVLFLGLGGPVSGGARAATVPEMLATGSLGNDKASVTMIEYASLTCPHCAAFENDTFPGFKAKYVDTGKVHYVYRDFPLDQLAVRAAMMARCADPDQYFGFVQVLFKQQDNWAAAQDPMAALARIGLLGGMSKDQFDACMANKDLLDGILRVRQDAQVNLKVDSTPTFFINGVKYAGDMSLDDLSKILDPLLGSQK
jgi:protein-disulfide isomerase